MSFHICKARAHLQHLAQDGVQAGDVAKLHASQPLLARRGLGACKLLRGAGVLLQRLDVQDAAAPAVGLRVVVACCVGAGGGALSEK